MRPSSRSQMRRPCTDFRILHALASRKALAPALTLALLPVQGAQQGWVAETPNFAVYAAEGPGLDAAAVASAAEDLESVRARALRDGFGLPRRADGPLDVLILSTPVDLHALVNEPLGSRTRGITINGLDRKLVVMAWHTSPSPRVTLAHEYSHQLDDPAWPLWFKEGRAVSLARRMPSRSGEDTVASLLALLGRADWLRWADLVGAESRSAVADSEVFQAQGWLFVQWLASERGTLTQLRPQDADAALARLGDVGLTAVLRDFAKQLQQDVRAMPAPFLTASPPTVARPSEAWEIPLLKAEVSRELRILDEAGPQLAGLARRFPDVARVQAAYASLLMMRGRPDEAERLYRRALDLGAVRARTAYRYALLMMRPGEAAESRVGEALRYSLRARDLMPNEPMHQLAVAQARMLLDDWPGAFEELTRLARFPGWGPRARREAAEVDRRRLQAIRSEPAPSIRPPEPIARVPVTLPDAFPPWKEPPAAEAVRTVRRIWPPYGTWLVHGLIAWVDCSGDEKKVILHSPYRRLVLRESLDEPPKLINRPFRSKALPCQGRGWHAAVAYRRLEDGSGFDGEIAGIRF